MSIVRGLTSLYGASKGSANEAADVRLGSLGLSRSPSAAAESAFPEGAVSSVALGRLAAEEPIGGMIST